MRDSQLSSCFIRNNMKVRDREMLRRWESENNERHRLSLEEKARAEDEKLQRIREEREELREMAEAAETARRCEEEERRKHVAEGILENSDEFDSQEEGARYKVPPNRILLI